MLNHGNLRPNWGKNLPSVFVYKPTIYLSRLWTVLLVEYVQSGGVVLVLADGSYVLLANSAKKPRRLRIWVGLRAERYHRPPLCSSAASFCSFPCPDFFIFNSYIPGVRQKESSMQTLELSTALKFASTLLALTRAVPWL